MTGVRPGRTKGARRADRGDRKTPSRGRGDERGAERLVGLMTGTSADAIEAALVRLSGEPPRLRWKLELHRSVPLEASLVRRILRCAEGEPMSAKEFTALHWALGETYAAAVLDLLGAAGTAPSEVAAIGLHGQTVHHRSARDPASAGAGGMTLQLGSAAVVAERTRIRVVHDFRSADVAAGGEGAPLVPYVDFLLFRSEHVARGLLNLGGIANLTAMPANAAAQDVIALDTGPANMVMDGIVRHFSGGRLAYDEDGRRAVGGNPDHALLAAALEDPFYDLEPPRSTGRERFGRAWLEPWLSAARERSLTEADLLVTAAVLSASAVAQAIEDFVAPRFPLDAVYASGGGVRNPVLFAALEAVLDPIHLKTVEELGLPSEAKEAVAFAVLAFESLHGRPGNLPVTTGAARRVVLGSSTLDRHLVESER